MYRLAPGWHWEEIFGPVLAVTPARDLDQALEIANSTEYALTGGLYSRSPQNIETVRRSFNVGNLYINRSITGAMVGRHPFGGFLMSGEVRRREDVTTCSSFPSHVW